MNSNSDFKFESIRFDRELSITLPYKDAKLIHMALSRYLDKQPQALESKAKTRLINARAKHLEIRNDKLEMQP